MRMWRRRCFPALRLAPFVLALALAAWLPLAASAQDAPAGEAEVPSPTELAEGRLGKMTKQLSLTEAQQAAIRPILLDHYQRLQALPSQWGKTWRKRAQLRTLMQQLDKQTAARIEKQLDEEQVAKFEKIRARYSDWMKEPPPTQPDRSAHN
jgi:Spy/CpxP family protein refolding chaperone